MLLSTTLLGLLLKGGWLMFPLLLLSLASVYIIVERWLTYRTHLYHTKEFLEALTIHLNNNNLEEVYQLCSPQQNIVQKVLYKGLAQRQVAFKRLELIIESESNHMIAFLEENLSILATISSVAPMVGFLGTVIGMIRTFMAIAQEQNHLSVPLFSSGIYEAMITTVAGLIVGITAYLGYHYCLIRVGHATQKLTYLGTRLLANIPT